MFSATSQRKFPPDGRGMYCMELIIPYSCCLMSKFSTFLECKHRAAVWALFCILFKNIGGRKNCGTEKIINLIKVLLHSNDMY